VSIELGATLRDAREARQLAFEEVSAATRIHPRYLAALEAERFDTLPGRAYARSFLHEYATYVGLDPAPLVSEYDERFCETRIEPAPLVRVNRPQHSHRRLASTLAVLILVGGGLAWKFGGGTHHAPAVAVHTPAAEAAVTKHVSQTTHVARHAVVRRVVVSAQSGPCWLAVRAGTSLVYEGTLAPGQTMRFAQRQLWIRLGAPWNARVTVDGKAYTLPSGRQPVNVTFSTPA
jgi:helix-turn-helix protein/uncharacterized protein DUF4115